MAPYMNYVKTMFFGICGLLFCLLFIMSSSVAKTIKNDVKKHYIVSQQVPAVEFGNNGDVIVYFLDKQGLKTASKEDFGAVLKQKIDYEKFEAKQGQVESLGYFNKKNIIVVGCEEDNGKENKKKEGRELLAQKAGAKVYSYLPTGRAISVVLSGKFIAKESEKKPKASAKTVSSNDFLIDVYFGLAQRNYKFDKYITDKKLNEEKVNIKKVVIDTKETVERKKYLSEIKAKLEGIFLVRDLVNEPANVVYPESYVNIIKNVFKGVKNVKVKILDAKDLQKLGMNLLLGVAQGSVKEPKVIIVEYKGNSKKKGFDLALVGKGVTFDSGGLSLKPSPYMEGMKGDMTGSATVLSSVLTMAKIGVKANVVAVGGLVENMPSGSAQKVGDIVRSMSGKTVEIIDTDAEGRLVLADVLYYAQTTYKPEYLIDMATLTGAIMVALGQSMSGIFSNSEKLAKALKESGGNTGDLCWVMPMGEEFAENMKSNIADLRNLSKVRYAGSATAAAFLENFVDDNKNWAHIDIAGVDMATSRSYFADADTATGYGIKLLVDFVKNNIEK